MAKETIIIGCRLPNGLTLILRDTKGQEVKRVSINGMNKSLIKGVTYTTTVVDAEFWAAWKAAHSDYAPLKNGALFDAATDDQAKFKGVKEYGKEKTGFEPMPLQTMGIAPSKE